MGRLSLPWLKSNVCLGVQTATLLQQWFQAAERELMCAAPAARVQANEACLM